MFSILKVNTVLRFPQYIVYGYFLRITVNYQYQEILDSLCKTIIELLSFETSLIQLIKIIFIGHMGNCTCGQRQFSMPSVEDRIRYKFAEDTNYVEFEHQDRIKCSSNEISLLKNLQSCEEKLRRSKRLFKDDAMPLQSVYIVDSQNPESKSLCLLERPCQIIDDISDQKYQVYNPKHHPKISDIAYDRSGLEYFGVFLCFLADHPSLIGEVILTSQNTYGIYVISMMLEGQKQPIYIDDRIMCKKKKPLFVHPIAGKYIWPILIEKAWLKIKGIQGNSIDKHSYMQVFNSFFNIPIKHFNLKEETHKSKEQDERIRARNEDLLQKHLNHIKHYHGCIVTTRKDPQHKLGIPKQTNLYLIKCFKYQQQTLFLLRNTNQNMGQFRGQHRMSTISEELMNQVFKYSNTQVTVEGNFILTKSEFLQQIQNFSIIYYEQQTNQLAQKVVPLKIEQDYFVSFTLHDNSLVNICLKQTIIGDPEPKYSPISYNIIRISNDEIISKETNNQSSNGVEMNYLLDGTFQNLKAGKYLIRLKKKAKAVFGKGKSLQKLLIFANSQATFDEQSQAELSKYFKALLPRLGQQELQQKKILEIVSFKQQCQIIHYWLGDLVVIYIEKNTTSKDCNKLELDFSEMKNLKCVTHPIVKSQQTAIEFAEHSLTIVLEKICLSDETILGHYIVQPF